MKSVHDFVTDLLAAFRADIDAIKAALSAHPDPNGDRLTALEAERDAMKARLDAIESQMAARFAGMDPAQ